MSTIIATNRWPRRLAAAAAALLVATAIALSSVQPAHANPVGPGYTSANGVHAGAWIVPNGQYAYCLEPGVPGGTTPDGWMMTSLPGYTASDLGFSFTVPAAAGATMAQINYLTSTYAATGDSWTAAAVHAAIWIARFGGEAGVPQGGTFGNYIIDYLSVAAPGQQSGIYAGGVALYYEAAAAVGSGIPVDASSGAPVTPISYLRDGIYEGTFTLPLGYSSATIDHGVFVLADGTEVTEVTSHVLATTTVRWRGTGSDTGSPLGYTVTFTGAYDTRTYGQGVTVYSGGTTGVQRVGNGIGFTGTTTLAYQDPIRGFTPMLESQVPSEYVAEGESFADTITLSAIEDSSAYGQPWIQMLDGTYAPIVATGTLYGPFLTPLEVSDTIPADAPVAATAAVTATGPGTYDVVTDVASPAAGDYTWVWEISQAAQGANEQPLLPDGYVFRDQFGLPSETQRDRTDVLFSTQLDKGLVLPGGDLVDTITPAITDGWFLDEQGTPLPIELVGTVYWTPEQPVQSATVPGHAVPVAELEATLGDPTTPVEVYLTAPAEVGWITIVYCVDTEASPHTEAYCDDYGIPSETAQVAVPVVPPAQLATTGTQTPLPLLIIAAGLLLAAAGITTARVVIARRKRQSA